MREISLKPYTEKDRKNSQYLDKINHAPYFTITMITMGALLLFSVCVLLGTF
jgi:quinol-cytochrome oxidoreductase complex cytochrome b subunit